MKLDEKQSLERVLESAIVVSWSDLVRDSQTGLIHIEYTFAPAGTLDSLQVWASLTRGRWLLVCSYCTADATHHGIGVRFENGYKSEGLAHILYLVMQHQGDFALPTNLGRQGLLQISTPTHEEDAAAGMLVRETLDRLDSIVAEPAVA